MSKTSKAKEKKRLRSSNSSTGEVEDDSQIIEKLISIQDRIENGFTKINEEIAALKFELKNDKIWQRGFKWGYKVLKRSLGWGFYNIPESAQEMNEECIQKVKQVLSDLGAPSDIKFHAFHRTGKPNTNFGAPLTSEKEPRLRPILERFVSRMD